MQKRTPAERQVRFSPYVFDLLSGDLWCDGIRRRLETQPARVLALLIEREGELVTRSELIATLWPGEVEGNFGRRLDKAVAKLRASLNDEPANPQFVETLRGRGYRFLPWVSCLTSEAPAIPEPMAVIDPVKPPPPVTVNPQTVTEKPADIVVNGPEPAAAPTHAFAGTWIRKPAALTVAAAAVLMLMSVAPRMHGHGRAAARKKPVLLILGFQDDRTASEDHWIARSVAGWLSTDLNSGGELEVVQAPPNLSDFHPNGRCAELPQKLTATLRRNWDPDYVVYGAWSSPVGASDQLWRLDACLAKMRVAEPPASITIEGNRGKVARLVSDAAALLRTKLG